jgi:hypothetical protein
MKEWMSQSRRSVRSRRVRKHASDDFFESVRSSTCRVEVDCTAFDEVDLLELIVHTIV